jgi:Flp pilus assembly protein TadD
MAVKELKAVRVPFLFAVVFASLLAIGHAAAPEKSPQKLRSLAVLPRGSFNLEMSLTSAKGPKVTRQEWKRRIARLREEVAREPKDAERIFHLAENLSAAESDEATSAFAKAAEIFRARAEARPRDGEIQIHFATALAAIGKELEAERVLRDAVKNASSNWVCWTALGDRLHSKAWGVVLGVTNRVQSVEQIENETYKARIHEIEMAIGN